MANQHAVESLRELIRILEIKQAEEGKILKDQFKITYESLKPVNFIKNSLKELTSSSELKGNLFESVTALLTGFITRKILVSSKSNILTKILGLIMQFGVSSLVARNADTIRIFIADLIDRFFKSTEETTATKI
jgi:hypothetical protein